MFSQVVQYLPKPEKEYSGVSAEDYKIVYKDIPDKARHYRDEKVIILNPQFCKTEQQALFLILHEYFHCFYDTEEYCDIGAILLMATFKHSRESITEAYESLISDKKRRIKVFEYINNLKDVS